MAMPPLQLLLVNDDRNLVSHPVILRLLAQKWESYAKRLVLQDSLFHLVLLFLWCLGTITWGESVETSCSSFGISEFGAVSRAGPIHALCLWLFYAMIAFLLFGEVCPLCCDKYVFEMAGGLADQTRVLEGHSQREHLDTIRHCLFRLLSGFWHPCPRFCNDRHPDSSHVQTLPRLLLLHLSSYLVCDGFLCVCEREREFCFLAPIGVCHTREQVSLCAVCRSPKTLRPLYSNHGTSFPAYFYFLFGTYQGKMWMDMAKFCIVYSIILLGLRVVPLSIPTLSLYRFRPCLLPDRGLFWQDGV